jgi:tRNA(adenine34) deaminase
MPFTRRSFLSALGLATAGALPVTVPAQQRPRNMQPIDSQSLPADARAAHERYMRLAIDQAKTIPAYPFGAVIIDETTGAVLAQGANRASEHSMHHGEIVAMNDYVLRYGNTGWQNTALYTTGEPCAMCTGAMVWAGIPTIVWASSIDTIRKSRIPQIDLTVSDVVTRSLSFYQPKLLLSGVLAEETDLMFANRPQSA